jgi:hypothetical protein
MRRWAEAAASARERRALWRGNAQRLYGVAVELAEIAQLQGQEPAADDAADSRENSDQLVIDVLREAIAAGLPAETHLASDSRFDYLKGNPDFAKLLQNETPAATE